jgi:hypothetical protein
MRKRLVGGLALSAVLGALASVGIASASTLEVDGGIIQHWQLPAEVDGLERLRAEDDVPDDLDAPAAPVDEGVSPVEPTSSHEPLPEPAVPTDEPTVPSEDEEAGAETGPTDVPAPTSPDGPVDDPAEATDDEATDSAGTTATP